MINSSLNNLAPYILARYPDMTVDNLSFLVSGFESDVYAFSLRHTDNSSKDYILRLFHGEGANEKIIHEAEGLPLLQQAGYFVPELLLYETDPQILGRPFEIIEKLEGRALWPVLATTTDEREIIRLLKRFGRLLSQLHKLDWRLFTPHSVSYAENPVVMLDELVAEKRSLYEKYDLKGFIQILDWLIAKKNEITFQPSVVHQDFHANNVFFCSNNELAVIDWTQIAVSDYRIDLCWTLMIMGDFGNPAWAKYILDAYKSSSNISVEDLDYFNVIVYTKLLASTVISFLASPEDLNMRSETLEAMKKQTAIFKVLAGRIYNITGITIPELEAILNTIE